MHGSKDKLVSPALTNELRQQIKNSKLITYSGGYLFFLFKERQSFLRYVQEFLNP